MLSIICGKPGSGKTYHISTLLVDMLTDWMRYELKNGEPFDSTIWTNIVFKFGGLNETIGKRIGKEVDVSKYLNICNDDFFHDDNCQYKKFRLVVFYQCSRYKNRGYGFVGNRTGPPAFYVFVTETDEVQVVMLYEKGVMLLPWQEILS